MGRRNHVLQWDKFSYLSEALSGRVLAADELDNAKSKGAVGKVKLASKRRSTFSSSNTSSFPDASIETQNSGITRRFLKVRMGTQEFFKSCVSCNRNFLEQQMVHKERNEVLENHDRRHNDERQSQPQAGATNFSILQSTTTAELKTEILQPAVSTS